jgi:hypothetical protein
LTFRLQSNAKMVEKLCDEEQRAVLMSAVAPGYRTIGAGIQAMEDLVAKSGVVVKFAACDTEATQTDYVAGTPPAKLLCLNAIIEIALVNAIKTGKATRESVGKVSSPAALLVPGNIIALYDDKRAAGGAFYRMRFASVDFRGGNKAIDALPFQWEFERFLVVDAGNGLIALYSPSHYSFLSVVNETFVASQPLGNMDDRPRANESFKVVHTNDGDRVKLVWVFSKKASPIQNWRIVQVQGFLLL